MNRRHRSLTASLPHRPSCSSWCRCQGETNRCLSPRVILILPPSSAWLTWRFPQRGQGALATASPSTRAETSTSRLRGEHEKPGRQAMKGGGRREGTVSYELCPFCSGLCWLSMGRALGMCPGGPGQNSGDGRRQCDSTDDKGRFFPLAISGDPLTKSLLRETRDKMAGMLLPCWDF